MVVGWVVEVAVAGFVARRVALCRCVDGVSYDDDGDDDESANGKTSVVDDVCGVFCASYVSYVSCVCRAFRHFLSRAYRYFSD